MTQYLNHDCTCLYQNDLEMTLNGVMINDCGAVVYFQPASSVSTSIYTWWQRLQKYKNISINYRRLSVVKCLAQGHRDMWLLQVLRSNVWLSDLEETALSLMVFNYLCPCVCLFTFLLLFTPLEKSAAFNKVRAPSLTVKKMWLLPEHVFVLEKRSLPFIIPKQRRNVFICF